MKRWQLSNPSFIYCNTLVENFDTNFDSASRVHAFRHLSVHPIKSMKTGLALTLSRRFCNPMRSDSDWRCNSMSLLTLPYFRLNMESSMFSFNHFIAKIRFWMQHLPSRMNVHRQKYIWFLLNVKVLFEISCLFQTSTCTWKLNKLQRSLVSIQKCMEVLVGQIHLLCIFHFFSGTLQLQTVTTTSPILSFASTFHLFSP